MYAWRARIGSITATPTEHFAYEFYKLAPPGVVCVPTCVSVDKVNREELAQQRQGLLRVAISLVMAKVDYIIVGGHP